MSSNDAELQALLDEHNIQKCLTRYAYGIDRHDTEVIESVFHPDGLDHHGSTVRTREELAEWGNALHSEHTRSHQHMLGRSTIDIDGNTAHAETYVLFVLWRKNEPIVDISGGRYIDRLDRRDGLWAIAERVVLVDWSAEAVEGPDVKGTLAGYARGRWDSTDPSYRRPLRWTGDDAQDPAKSFGSLLTNAGKSSAV